MTRGTANGVVGTRLFWKTPPNTQVGAASARPGIPGGVYAPPFTADHPPLPCAEDPELFQPDGYSVAWEAQIEKAKTICRGCPAVADCWAWAVDHGEPYGIWGATTPEERAQDRKRAGLPAVRGGRSGLHDQRGRRVG